MEKYESKFPNLMAMTSIELIVMRKELGGAYAKEDAEWIKEIDKILKDRNERMVSK